MVDPGTAILIAAGVGTAAKGVGDYLSGRSSKKSGKIRAQELKRETQAGLFQDALQRSAELEAQRLNSSNRLGKRRTQSLQDTTDLIRGAFGI